MSGMGVVKMVDMGTGHLFSDAKVAFATICWRFLHLLVIFSQFLDVISERKTYCKYTASRCNLSDMLTFGLKMIE